MNFDFSDDQKTVREEARRFLAKRCTTEVPRRILESDEPFDRELWAEIAKMGWLGTAIPEEYGGVGLGYLELCVIAEQLGRSLAPIPFSSSVYLAAEALLLAGSEAQKKEWLPKIASGEAIGTFALAEGIGAISPSRLSVRASGGKLSGTKSPVPDGDVADFAIALARTSDGDGEDNASLFLVRTDAPGATRASVASIDPTRSLGTLTFDGAPAEALGASGQGWALTERILDRATIPTAMEQVGGADVALAMAQEYARGRYAFGRQIGSFQAIKHKLADMYVKNELARSNAYFGAWAIANDADELPVAAATARLAATEAFHFASKECIQVHGGNGFTWEYDCHLYYRRARLLAASLGAPRAWKQKLLARLVARAA